MTQFNRCVIFRFYNNICISYKDQNIIDKNLKLSLNNSKILALSRSEGVNTAAFNLTAGKTCVKADICHAWVNGNGKITRGPNCTVICNMAKVEARYPITRRAHAHNTTWIKNHSSKQFRDNMSLLLDYHGIRIMRINASGDFLNDDYFNAWVAIAASNHKIDFFGYTKIFKYWKIIKENNFDNMRFVFSLGSKDDDLVLKNNANTCAIVKPDHNFKGAIICQKKDNKSLSEDYHYIMQGLSFGLTLK